MSKYMTKKQAELFFKEETLPDLDKKRQNISKNSME